MISQYDLYPYLYKQLVRHDFYRLFRLKIFYVFPSKPRMGCRVSKQRCHDQPTFSIFNIDINKQKIVLIFEKIRIVTCFTTWFATEKINQCIIPYLLDIYHYIASRKFAIANKQYNKRHFRNSMVSYHLVNC